MLGEVTLETSTADESLVVGIGVDQNPVARFRVGGALGANDGRERHGTTIATPALVGLDESFEAHHVFQEKGSGSYQPCGVASYRTMTAQGRGAMIVS